MLGLHKCRLTTQNWSWTGLQPFKGKGQEMICGRADDRQWRCNIIKYLLRPERPELLLDLTARLLYSLKSLMTAVLLCTQPVHLLALDFPWYQPYNPRQYTAVIVNGQHLHAFGPENICVSLAKSSKHRS